MSRWKKANWDRWTPAKKIRHCIAVALSLLTSSVMLLIALYLILFIFGLQGFILKLRDTILLEIMHTIFG